MINKAPTTIINAGSYLEGLRDNFKLDVKLIAQKRHPKVYLLSSEEISLTLSSIDTSTPEGWDCAMATLKSIYWKNYRGYMDALKDLPYDRWKFPLFDFKRTLCEILTDRLDAVKLDDIEAATDTKIDPKEITDNVKYAGGVRRNGFDILGMKPFGHNPDAVAKGSKGS